ncbi:MAG: molybdopterin cofactor-binding domain-containing protein, partial [Burkholderiales bacterium]
DAPVLHDKVGTNVVAERSFRYGEPEAAFAAAAHRIGIEISYPRNSCTPIECGVVVAEYAAHDGSYDVLSNFMGPFSLHSVMALALGVPGARLRHRSPRDSGGSFGVKQSLFPYIVAICLAARKVRVPVKWTEDRLEHLAAATSATARRTRLDAAVSADGRITALDYDQIDECGAYLRAPEPATLYRMHGALTGAYAIANLSVRNRSVLTNKTPTGLVRGFGGPQVYFALERLIQRIAADLGMDLLEVYRRNFVRAFPYRAAAGALYDSGDYAAAMSLACAQGGWEELRARQQKARAEGRLYGIGCAAIVEPSISNMGYVTTALTAAERARAGPKNGAIATATVNVDPLGAVSVIAASTPAGQGHATVLAQVVAETLGLAPDNITINLELDTQKDAWTVASGNYSSRFAGAVAGAASLAAERIRARIAGCAARELDVPQAELVFANGKIFPREEPQRSLSFRRVAGVFHWSPAQLLPGETPALRETAFWSAESLAAPDDGDHINSSAAYGFVFDLCAVEIDRDTGRVRVDRYVSAHDAGRLLNPMLADGQIRGGFAQGLGAALYEEFAYSADGAFLAGTLVDYLLPTACETPDPVILHMESPSPFTPLGAKGIGEGNNMSTPAAIANAVADALGVSDVQLPLTPRRVLDLIDEDEPPPSAGTRKSQPVSGTNVLAAGGSVIITALPEAVFAALTDAQSLARIIPGCSGLQRIDADRYRAEVVLGVGPVKARYAAEIALFALQPPHLLCLEGRGESMLGAAHGKGTVRLEAVGAGTRLSYEYRTEITGKIAAIGSRMLEGAARSVIAGIFDRLAALLQAPAPELAPWWRRWKGRKEGGA